MIKLLLNEMLENRGMSAYALHVKSKKRLHQSVISKIKKNDSKALQLDTLDMLCELLDCQPADLIVYESGDTTQSVSTTQNVARATQSTKHTQSVDTTQSASSVPDYSNIPDLPVLDDKNDMWLATKDVGEFTNRDARTVRDFYKQGLTRTETKSKGSFVKLSDLTAFWNNRDK
jgi:putative transcriptional regulator